MKNVYMLIGLLLMFVSCTIAPSKIIYGIDGCSFCDMTIVNKTHAAIYVTNKGRSYKFDAIECMINDLTEKDESQMTYMFVTDYLNPTVLINAKKARYLISTEIKSPMGANLSAFTDKSLIKINGEQFNWDEIKKKIRK